MACAAMPSLCLMSPSSRCSVPTYICPSSRASSWARLMTLRAFSVNLSNMVVCTPYAVTSGRMCGKGSTSRMEGWSVRSIAMRSMPMPMPPVGGMPYSRART